MNDSHQCARLSFILRRRRPSDTEELPVNSTVRILTFGPSLIVKVTCTSLGPPSTGLISCEISADWNPFSFIMSRMIPSILRMRAGSMKVSRRICALFSFSFSSIFAVSSFFEPTKSTIFTR